jgi:histidinol-phosphate phosphatase family protein
MTKFFDIDHTWTLFLDRDGVINRRIVDDYVKKIDDFVFLDGVLDSIKIFSRLFNRIVVVTNQRGIALGVMNADDLSVIHNYMINEIENIGGRVDRIYYCPHDKTDNCSCRKPKPGMLIKAQNDFPDIDFSKSIMVGDSESDMGLGRSRSLKNVFISETSRADVDADIVFPSLKDFEEYLNAPNPQCH